MAATVILNCPLKAVSPERVRYQVGSLHASGHHLSTTFLETVLGKKTTPYLSKGLEYFNQFC